MDTLINCYCWWCQRAFITRDRGNCVFKLSLSVEHCVVIRTCTVLVTGTDIRRSVSGVLQALSYCFEENPFRFLVLTKQKVQHSRTIQIWIFKSDFKPSQTVNVKKCRATIVIMTTGITNLVLLVLMATAMYFLIKIYSAIRAVECNLHTVHDAGMEVTGRRMEQTGVVHGKQQTPIWSVENTGRDPEEHDERKIQVSQLRFVKNITSL